MAQTPRAGTGDSVGRFRHYRCSTLFNYSCNLSLCCTFLPKLLPLPDKRGSLPSPTETYDLNLSAVTFSNWSFRTPTSIFCTEELYNPGLPPFFFAQPPSPLFWGGGGCFCCCLFINSTQPPSLECIQTLKGTAKAKYVRVEPTKHESPHQHYRDATHAKVPGRWTVALLLLSFFLSCFL